MGKRQSDKVKKKQGKAL